jgi:hypothetical protein
MYSLMIVLAIVSMALKASPILYNTTVSDHNEITSTHCHNDGTYHYHGQRKLPQFVVECTDYNTDLIHVQT